MLRLIHTADWHLGHTLHGLSREAEHQAFLDWLLGALESESADALIIAGDVFDSANPPAAAQAMFYRFLAAARMRCPQLDVLVIAGNHDSAARLDAPSSLLDGLGIRIIGALPRTAAGDFDAPRLVVPLYAADGGVAARVAAVPFLRPADLPPCPEDEDPLIAGVEAVYAEALAAARAQRRSGEALLATGHAYLVGGQLSALSERRILGGHQHALPAALFPEDVAYVALGHLHLAQRVAGRDGLRYAGAPLPFAFAENRYPHQVLRVDLDGERLAAVEPLPVPQHLELLRRPDGAAQGLDEVLADLARLALDAELPASRWPCLEVSVRLERPEPGLRRRIELALDKRPVRLLTVVAHHCGRGESLGDEYGAGAGVENLSAGEVFRRCHVSRYRQEPDAGLLDAFCKLLEEVESRK